MCIRDRVRGGVPVEGTNGSSTTQVTGSASVEGTKKKLNETSEDISMYKATKNASTTSKSSTGSPVGRGETTLQTIKVSSKKPMSKSQLVSSTKKATKSTTKPTTPIHGTSLSTTQTTVPAVITTEENAGVPLDMNIKVFAIGAIVLFA